MTDVLDQDPVHSAAIAGLRYVSDSAPGLGRRRRGKGFVYVDADGRPVRDAATLDRIRRLAIPPAWTDVWICPDPNGHIQAVGRDARGRKQYRYHARWRKVRDETKYDRMAAFARALPRIRARVAADVARPGLPREKVLATIVRLLEMTHIRVGNEEYARDNGSYGLTTLKGRHVRIRGATIQFRFRGKSGKVHEVVLPDRHLARIVARCRDIPGQDLFQYVDDDGSNQNVGSADVNAYLREVSGEDFTAKDFRTWAGTKLAALELAGVAATKRNVVRAIAVVAERLGNTPAICRRCYVHPAVFDAHVGGTLAEAMARRARTAGLAPEEAAVLRLLEAVAAAPKPASLETQLERAARAARRERARARRTGGRRSRGRAAV